MSRFAGEPNDSQYHPAIRQYLLSDASTLVTNYADARKEYPRPRLALSANNVAHRLGPRILGSSGISGNINEIFRPESKPPMESP